jgi:hypothetical protein
MHLVPRGRGWRLGWPSLTWHLSLLVPMVSHPRRWMALFLCCSHPGSRSGVPIEVFKRGSARCGDVWHVGNVWSAVETVSPQPPLVKLSTTPRYPDDHSLSPATSCFCAGNSMEVETPFINDGRAQGCRLTWPHIYDLSVDPSADTCYRW